MKIPTVCALTAYTPDFSDTAAIAVPHIRDYAARQGYECRVLERTCERKAGWVKIEPIRVALSDGFDFVLWLDADVLVIRKDADVREAADDAVDIQMAWHTIGNPHFNTGVMLIRSSDWSRQFFASVWERGPITHAWNDQATILHLLGYDDALAIGPRRTREPNLRHVAALDAAWNAIVGYDLARDPIIHHYAGVADRVTRLALMRDDAANITLRAQQSLRYREISTRWLNRRRRELVPL
jgi:hypothetical protein